MNLSSLSRRWQADSVRKRKMPESLAGCRRGLSTDPGHDEVARPRSSLHDRPARQPTPNKAEIPAFRFDGHDLEKNSIEVIAGGVGQCSR